MPYVSIIICTTPPLELPDQKIVFITAASTQVLMQNALAFAKSFVAISDPPKSDATSNLDDLNVSEKD